MTKPLKLIFLLIGCLLLGWAVSTVDLLAVADLLIKLGYGFIIILILYSSVTWVDTIAWKNNFKKEETRQFSLWSLWCIRQIGEAYNTITPLGTLGGEPIKAQLLKERHGLSLKQGMASQVIARTTFLIALILFFIPGIFFTMQSEIISEKIKMACLLAMSILSILILFFLIFQVTGTLGKLARWASKLPLGKKMGVFLGKLELLDQGISSYYRHGSSSINSQCELFHSSKYWRSRRGATSDIYSSGNAGSLGDNGLIRKTHQGASLGLFRACSKLGYCISSRKIKTLGKILFLGKLSLIE